MALAATRGTVARKKRGAFTFHAVLDPVDREFGAPEEGKAPFRVE